MKLLFLGTSAGEEYPGIWCDCEYCAKARRFGGRNIRRNSAVMIDGDTMIDIGKTAHIQAERFGANIRGIRNLLVTHSHIDHFDIHTMWSRQMSRSVENLTPEEQKNASSPRFTRAPAIEMFGSAQVEEAMKAEVNLGECNINFHKVIPYENYTANNLELFTLEGNHPDGSVNSINYIVRRGGVTFLYLTDTGWPFERTLDEIAKHKYDFIIVEGTFGFGVDSLHHMNFEKNVRLLDFFNANKLWKDKPDCYLTHIAPHWSPPHDDYLPHVESAGMKLAYDGLVIDTDS